MYFNKYKIYSSYFIYSTLLLFTLNAQALIITETYTNTLASPDNIGCGGKSQYSSNQVIEIYNDSASPIDLNGYKITDGTGTDTIVPWSTGFNGPLLNNINILNDGSAIIPPDSYALILDPDYGVCDQYINIHFPKDIYLLTVSTGAVPGSQSFGTSGIGPTESITIKLPDDSTVVATFGSSFTPSDPGEDKSWELIDLNAGDIASNYEVSTVNGNMSLGFTNSVSAIDLILTEIFHDNPSGSNSINCVLTFNSSNQYIEVYNNMSIPLDLSDYQISDATGIDYITSWKASFNGTLLGGTGFNLVNENSSVLPSGKYGLILDPDYAVCDQALQTDITGDVHIFSIKTSSAIPGGQSFGASNISSSESVTLNEPDGTLLSQYGSALLPHFPFTTGDNNSIERKLLTTSDTFTDWQNSNDYQGRTPGRSNTITDNQIIITEVMSVLTTLDNSCCDNGTTNTRSQTLEYIEVYNKGTTEVELDYFSLTDGTGIDYISPWTVASGVLKNSGVLTNTTVLNPGSYAVILDPDYAFYGDQAYDFPPNALILTIGSPGAGTKSLGTNGLSSSEAITLYNGSGLAIATAGTPNSSYRVSYTDAIDDGADAIPFSPGANRSLERIDNAINDNEDNWMVSTDIGTFSPGGPNSITKGVPLIAFEKLSTTPELNSGESKIAATFQLTSNFPVHQIGFTTTESIDSSTAQITLKLYLDNSGSNESLSGSQTLINTFNHCPSTALVQNISASSEQIIYFGKRDWVPFIEGREVVIQDDINMAQTYPTQKNALNYIQGSIQTPTIISSEYLISNNSIFKCGKGIWLIDGQSLVNGRYKLEVTLDTPPSSDESIELAIPNGWVRDHSNASNLMYYIADPFVLKN